MIQSTINKIISVFAPKDGVISDPGFGDFPAREGVSGKFKFMTGVIHGLTCVYIPPVQSAPSMSLKMRVDSIERTFLMTPKQAEQVRIDFRNQELEFGRVERFPDLNTFGN